MSSIKDQIRQEIERRIENYWSDGDVDSVVVSGELEELIDFIDSLPEEKPSEDLEEAADDMALKAFPEKKSYSTVYERVVDYNAVDRKNYRDGIIAGAEWQKEQDMDEWLKDRDGCFWDGVNEGKKAMEEQMMKEAVEGEVWESEHGIRDIVLQTEPFQKVTKGLKEGDKVKIIIVKEDDKG